MCIVFPIDGCSFVLFLHNILVLRNFDWFACFTSGSVGRYENTGAGSSLMCRIYDSACADNDWIVDSDDATSGVPVCTFVVGDTYDNHTTNNSECDVIRAHSTC